MNYGSVCDWLIGLGRPKTWLWLWTFAATKSPARHPTIRCVHPNSKWSPCVKPKYIKSSEHIQLIIIVVLILIILRLTWISLFLGWFGIKLINFYPFLIPTYLIKKKKKTVKKKKNHCPQLSSSQTLILYFKLHNLWDLIQKLYYSPLYFEMSHT